MIFPTKSSEGVYRGPEPSDYDFERLQKLGIRYCLDLQSGMFEDGCPKEEQSVAKDYGIEGFALPLGRFLPPTKRELETAAAIIEAHKPIYVHCKSGVDRTGMVMAYYEMKHGRTRANAIQEMKIMGMHWWYYFWAWFL